MGILARAVPLFAVGLPAVLAGEELAWRPAQAAGSAVLASGSLASVGARAAAFGPADAYEEFERRAWALDPRRFEKDLRAALGSGSWTRRAAALDALERAAALGDALRGEPWVRAAAREAALDPHPNLRAAGLALLVHLPGPDGLTAEEVRALGQDPWSEAREHLANLLGRRRDPADPAVLLGLCRDGDARVASRARRSLALRFAAEPGDAERIALAEEWARLGALEDYAGALEVAGVIARVGAAPEALEALLADLAEAALEPRALVAALLHAAGGEAGREDLLAGWLSAPTWSSERQDLFLAAAHGREGLAQPLFLSGVVIADHGRSEIPAHTRRLTPLLEAWEGLREPGERPRHTMVAQHLFRAVRAAEGPNGLARRVLAMVDPTNPRAVLGLAELTREPFTWEREVAALFVQKVRRMVEHDLGHPRQMIEVLAASALMEDPHASQALVDLLDVGGEVGAAVRHTLARVAYTEPLLEPLGTHIARLEGDEWLDGLLSLRQSYALPALRERLLEELGDPQGAQERAAALLGAFQGDLEVAERLERRLIEALHALDEPFPRGGAALGLANVLVGALARVAPQESVEVFQMALEASVGRHPALGRQAASSLGRSEPGRDLLVRWLEEDLDRSTRLEVAAELVRAGDGARAFDTFAAGLRSAPPELAARLLDRFALRQEPRLDPFLLELAADGGAERELRHGALSALARRPGEEGSAQLAGLVRGLGDVELALAALRALGARAGAGAAEELLALGDELAREPAARVSWPPRAVELREAFAAQWLEAAAAALEQHRRGPGAQGPIGGWRQLAQRVSNDWWRPLVEDGEDLWNARLARMPQAAAHMRYQAQFEAARVLGRMGWLSASLEQVPLERLDGRTLLSLVEHLHWDVLYVGLYEREQEPRAEVSQNLATAGLPLARAAVVALAGEGPLGTHSRNHALRLLLELTPPGPDAERLSAILETLRSAGDWRESDFDREEVFAARARTRR